jgi:hypothetical protein
MPGTISTLNRQYADGSAIPPTYTIDLSLPPEQRYVAMARDYISYMEQLTYLFDNVAAMNPLGLSVKTLKRLARFLLRRVYDREQTAELRGISKATGVDMYLLVAANVLLDLFMGCTSGGARVKTPNGSKVVHFRTLDWIMDELRSGVVHLEFVEKRGGPVIGRSVTYVGFVGILTGVRYGCFRNRFMQVLTYHRQDLSLSLNFRALLNESTNYYLYIMHQLSVLLGLRPSIASKLRHLILPPRPKWTWMSFKTKEKDLPTYTAILQKVPLVPTTACYLTFSDGNEMCVIEKDRITGTCRTSRTFISVTNHDVSTDGTIRNTNPATYAPNITSREEVLEESYERRDELEKRYQKIYETRNLDSALGEDGAIDMGDIERLMLQYPTSNGWTHFAAIMDPTVGDISWIRWWKRPKKS